MMDVENKYMISLAKKYPFADPELLAEVKRLRGALVDLMGYTKLAKHDMEKAIAKAESALKGE